MKHIIWTNFDLPEIGPMEREEYPDATDYEIQCLMCRDWLADEEDMLNVGVGTIIKIADLGLWHGRRSAYKVIDGTRLSACLQFEQDDEFTEWYVEDGEFKGTGVHHDGTNHYVYRLLKDADPEIIASIRCRTLTVDQVLKVTEPLGDMVSKIYGW